MGFSGAECFEDKSPPLMAAMEVVGVPEFGGADASSEVVQDAHGVGVHAVLESSLSIVVYHLCIEPGDRCNAVLSLLQPRMTEAQLLVLGFEKQVC